MTLLRHRASPGDGLAFTAEDWRALMWHRWMSRIGVEPLMPVEEYEEEGTLVVRVDIPGVNPDTSLDVYMTDHSLTITTERQAERQTEQPRYVRQEINYGRNARTLPLPAGVVDNDVKAVYRDGVLEVRFPLAESSTSVQSIPVYKAVQEGALPVERG